MSTWIRHLVRPELSDPVAVVGSPGLRSVGQLVIDYLKDDLKPTLIAELHSSHFPLFYQTSPSYTPSPEFPGEAGVRVDSSRPTLPEVEFHYSSAPELIITRGYHANFYGQYEVAERVLDVFEEWGVQRLIVIAGYAQEGADVCCAATNVSLLKEMEGKGIGKGYEGPFYGFSGLVFGLAALRDMKGICLFGRTQLSREYPESPDRSVVDTIIEKLYRIL